LEVSVFVIERKRANLRRARATGWVKVSTLADRTTFQVDAFARFGEHGDVDVLITDSAPDPDAASDVEGISPRVVRA
jgi:DeoR family fructose operon transcriptional repressor